MLGSHICDKNPISAWQISGYNIKSNREIVLHKQVQCLWEREDLWMTVKESARHILFRTYILL